MRNEDLAIHNRIVMLYCERSLKGLTAFPKNDQSKFFKLDMQNAVVNFVILGKLYNVSMKHEDERHPLIRFFQWIRNEKIEAMLDGKYAISPELGNVVEVTRLIVLHRLSIFDAIMFTTCITLEKNGWFPKSNTLSIREYE